MAEHGVLFGQLLVGIVEAEIVTHLAAPLIDLAHGIVGGVHQAVAVKVLAVGEQQDGNHLEQDEQDDEVIFQNETPKIVHFFNSECGMWNAEIDDSTKSMS